MGKFENIDSFLSTAHNIMDLYTESLSKESYTDAGVIGTSNFSSQVGSPSAEVLLTDGIKRKKKHKISKEDAEGLITTSNGKKIKLTGLSEKEKDEYLFGSANLKKAISHLDVLINYLEGVQPTKQEGASE